MIVFSPPLQFDVDKVADKVACVCLGSYTHAYCIGLCAYM